jgi:hypothetical protein
MAERTSVVWFLVVGRCQQKQRCLSKSRPNKQILSYNYSFYLILTNWIKLSIYLTWGHRMVRYPVTSRCFSVLFCGSCVSVNAPGEKFAQNNEFLTKKSLMAESAKCSWQQGCSCGAIWCSPVSVQFQCSSVQFQCSSVQFQVSRKLSTFNQWIQALTRWFWGHRTARFDDQEFNFQILALTTPESRCKSIKLWKIQDQPKTRPITTNAICFKLMVKLIPSALETCPMGDFRLYHSIHFASLPWNLHDLRFFLG